MADNDNLLAQFQDITGIDAERAKFYLESANWQLDLAMANFYEGDGEDESVMEIPMDDPPPPQQAQEGGTGPGKIKIGFAGEDSDSSSEEEGQAFYAGGSTSSGQQILGPGKKKDKKNDIVGDMFKAARDAGAEQVESGSGVPGGSKAKSFLGSGFRLGTDSTASQPVAGAAAEVAPRHFVLKMWQDGFSVDDGDIRPYQDPENREFLQSVMRGAIPPELVKEAKGGEVHVDMEDHRNDQFEKPKSKPKPFQGKGNVLGSIAPSVTEAPVAAANADPKAAEEAAAKAFKVDSNQPTTSVQVRLADGSRLIVKLNHTHTVGHLRSYITMARSQYAGVSFALMTTFPNKELTDDSQSLAAAGLLGAAVLQRLK